MKRIILFGTMILSLIFSVGSVSASSCTDANQNQIFFNYRYSRDLNNTCYWVSSSASSLTNHINNAAYDWAHLSNPIVMTPVSTSYATHMDLYGKSNSFWPYFGPNAYVLGSTQHFNSSGNAIDADSSGNWFYADIYLNLDALNYNLSIQATIAHEMGHAFGLAHWNSNPYSIMTQDSCGRLVSTVQEVDNQHLNQKY